MRDELADTILTVEAAEPVVIRLPEAEAAPPKRLGADFARLWGAATVSALGDGVRETALPLLAALVTRNPMLVAGILFAGKLPWLLCSLPAGAIADRVDRRKLVVYVNLFRAAVMGALAVTVATGGGVLWLLYAVAFLQGVGEVVSDNTAFAMLPSLLSRGGLEKANGRLEAAVVVGTNFAGPALGGVLFATALASPFALDAVSFAAAAALFFSIRFRAPARTAPPAPTTLRSDIKEGLRWLRNQRFLCNLSVIAALTNFVLHATFGIFVLYTLEVLHVHAAGFGLLLSVEAAGALSGSLLASWIKRRFGTVPSVLAALLIAGAGNLVLGMTSSVVVVGAMMLAISFGGGLWNVVTNSLRQALVPDRLLGRVQSAHRLLSWGAIPIGTMFGGAMAQAFGLRAPFLIAAAALVLLALGSARLLRSAFE